MKNIIKNTWIICCMFFGIMSCSDDARDSLDLSGDVDIRSFTVNGVAGTIDNSTSTINVLLPAGSDLTSLAPQITIAPSAEIKPKSGEALNFTNSVKYTVSDKDIYQIYTVSVQVVKAEITKFTIGDRTGVIDQSNHTIEVKVAAGTDLTKLVPTVEYTSGAIMTPTNGSIVDFTNPVTYTLEYQGSTFTYEVTVIYGIPPLVIYNGEDIVPNWWNVGTAGTINSTANNPQTDAINTTAKCASRMRLKTDDPWSGGGLGGLDIDPSVYTKFSLMVWKEYAGNVQLEIQGNGGNNQYLKVMYSDEALGQWQKLIFELPTDHGFTKIHTILVAPQVDDTKNDDNFSDQVMYWDELNALPVD